METPVTGKDQSTIIAPESETAESVTPSDNSEAGQDLTEDDFMKQDESPEELDSVHVQQKDEQSKVAEVDLELNVEADALPKLEEKFQQFLPHEMERWGRLRDRMLGMTDLEQYATKVDIDDGFAWSSDEAFASYLLDCLEEDLAHGGEIMPEDTDARPVSSELLLVYPHQGARWERLRDRMLSIPYLDRYIIKYPRWSHDEILSCCLLDRLEEQLENVKQEALEKERHEELEKLQQEAMDSREDGADDDGEENAVDGDDCRNKEDDEEEDDNLSVDNDLNYPGYSPDPHCNRRKVKAPYPSNEYAPSEQGDKMASENAKKETRVKPKIRVFICNLCNWHSDTKTKATEHFEEKHWDPGITGTAVGLQARKRPLPTRTKDFATMFWCCLECDAYVKDLTEHKQSCPGVTCEVCGKICPKRCILRSHIKRRHTLKKEELKNQLCDHCGKMFYSRSDLNIHVKRHLGIVVKNHVCKTCGKAFSTGDKLNRHKAIHMEEKPFECSYCGQRFTQKYNMKLHTRVHTGIKPYECDMCSESFNHNVSLKNHKKKAHGIDWWKKGKLPEDHPVSRHVTSQK